MSASEDLEMSDDVPNQQASQKYGVTNSDDGDVDATPEFIDMNDAVEVAVDDDNVPMDDDDDDDDNVAAAAAAATTDSDIGNDIEKIEGDQEVIVDMSFKTYTSHTDSVFAVATAIQKESAETEKNILRLVSGGGDDKAYFHVNDNSQLLSAVHTDSVACVAFNLDFITSDTKKTPPLMAVGSFDGTIQLYDPYTAQHLFKFDGPTDIEWLSFHPKGGSVILAGSSDGTVWMYHVPLQKCLQVFVGHEASVTAGDFTSNGKLAVTASADGTVRLWAPKTGMSKHVFKFTEPSQENTAGLTCMTKQHTENDELFVVGAEDGRAHVCHVGTKKVIATLQHYEIPNNVDDEDIMQEYPMSVEAVGFCNSNLNWCATGGVDGVVKIWDLSLHGQCRHSCKLTENNGGITRLKWHPSLPLVFASNSTGTIHLWDARDGQLLHTITGHSDMINDMDIQFQGDNNNLAVVVTAGDDKTVKIFHIDINQYMK